MTTYFKHGCVAFREIQEEDLPVITAMRNDFSTWPHLGDPRLTRPGLQKRWLESLNQSSDRMYFMATLSEVGREKDMIALIRMDEYDVINRSLRVGADVFPAWRHQGLGTKIYEAMKAYAFDDLGLHRIWLLVLDTNSIAIHLYEKVGFKVEGRMRQAIFRAGAWRDYIVMSLLEHEYRGRA